ncbi:SDR family NAD(P)-dependent oxidoreductase [Bradyrhizobium retamae]|nr:SDR family NAD(P)-dependent oxidoreductase [Bradyrhizobium retamae]
MSAVQRVALITGSASGIGAACARRLAAKNVNLLLVDRQGEALQTIAQELSKTVRTSFFVCDITDDKAVEGAVSSAKGEFGRIDILANIAGGSVGVKGGRVEDFSGEDWDRVMNANLRSTFMFCKFVVPMMREQKFGRIINTSSTLARGRTGSQDTSAARLPYAAAKAGVLGFTSQLAKDLGSEGITVNAILPWLTIAPNSNQAAYLAFMAMSAEARERQLSLSPFKRPATADEVAAAIEFLASDDASYISGVALPIDGAFL